MCSVGKTLGGSLLGDIGMLGIAVAAVGVSFGALAVSRGEPLWVPLAMSLTVFAAGAQLATLDVALGGGGAAAAVAAGLLLNARLLPLGLTVAEALKPRGPGRLLGGLLLVDQSAALALAQRGSARRKAAFVTCGVVLYAMWNLGTLAGALAGRVVGDPGALGLDAAEPVVLLALVLPALREPRPRRAALTGAAIALACTPYLPAGLPVLLALLGTLAGSGTWPRAPRPARQGKAGPA